MPADKKNKGNSLPSIKNSKAFHKYTVGDTFEAGLSLKGTEVKSVRNGDAQISEAFVRIEKGNATLYNAQIKEYEFGNTNNHPPARPRRLLLHSKEIAKLKYAVEAEGATIIPLKLYFKKGLIKIEIAICKGKKLFDKRNDMKKRDAMREADRDMKRFNR